MVQRSDSFPPNPPTHSIVQKVASVTDRDPLELPPLYDTINPEALNNLIDGLANGQVKFSYAETTVVIDADGQVSVSRNTE